MVWPGPALPAYLLPPNSAHILLKFPVGYFIACETQGAFLERLRGGVDVGADQINCANFEEFDENRREEVGKCTH